MSSPVGEQAEKQVPAAMKVVLVWTSHLPPSDPKGSVRHIVEAKYGPKPPRVRTWQVAAVLGFSMHPTVDDAKEIYSKLLETGQIQDYGTPSDGFAGTTADGSPAAALFFWTKTRPAGKGRWWRIRIKARAGEP